VKKNFEVNLSLKTSLNSSLSLINGERLFEEYLRSRIELEK
jgi:hypothetical protein